jgi:hypothetical protein
MDNIKLPVDMESILVPYVKKKGSVKKGDFVWVTHTDINDGTYALMRIKVGEICEMGGNSPIAGAVSVAPANQNVHTGFGTSFLVFDKDREKVAKMQEEILHEIYDQKIKTASAVIDWMTGLKQRIKEEPKTLHTAKSLVMGAHGIGMHYTSIPGSDTGIGWIGDTPEDLTNAVDLVRSALEDIESIEK